MSALEDAAGRVAADVQRAIARIRATEGNPYRPDQEFRPARYRLEWVDPLEAEYWDDPTRMLRFGDTLRTVRGELPIRVAPAYRLVPITDREERPMTTNDDDRTTLEATVPAAEAIRDDRPTPRGVITIDPGIGWPDVPLGRGQVYDQVHQDAAEQVWRVLSGTLAQGTLERLLILMLTDRAGYRIVRARAVPVDALVLDGVTDAGVRELAEAEQALADQARRWPPAVTVGPKVFGYTLDALGRLDTDEAGAMARRIDALLEHSPDGPIPGSRAVLVTALAILRRQR